MATKRSHAARHIDSAAQAGREVQSLASVIALWVEGEPRSFELEALSAAMARSASALEAALAAASRALAKGGQP